jgi:hypothetical protein
MMSIFVTQNVSGSTIHEEIEVVKEQHLGQTRFRGPEETNRIQTG